MSKHIKSDGNGGLVINKKVLVLLGTIIAVISLLIGMLSSVLALNTDFVILKEDVKSMKEDNSMVHPMVVQNKEDIAVVKVTLNRIDLNVQKLLEGG